MKLDVFRRLAVKAAAGVFIFAWTYDDGSAGEHGGGQDRGADPILLYGDH